MPPLSAPDSQRCLRFENPYYVIVIILISSNASPAFSNGFAPYGDSGFEARSTPRTYG